MVSFGIRSLQTRLLVFLLIPVVVLLLLGGGISFWYARGIMLDQWNESAVLKLQRAAHFIEMRLLEPVNFLNVLFRSSESDTASVLPEQVVAVLQSMDGVVSAVYNPAQSSDPPDSLNSSDGHPRKMGMGRSMPRGGMRFYRSRIADVSGPQYQADRAGQTVEIQIVLLDESEKIAGTLSIQMTFDFLLSDILELGWWQSDMACIVDENNRYLAHTNMTMADRHVLGETSDPLERSIAEQLRIRSFGTVASAGHPPDMVAGFYKLHHVPWAILLFADGRTILDPIVTYRNVLALGSLLLAGMVLLLIRCHLLRVVRQIQHLSERARGLEKGDYGQPIPVESQDEIGRLVEGFNAMVSGLRERDYIRDCFGRYVDPEFAKTLMHHPEAGRLGGNRRDAVILMSDIRGFTRLSETLAPEKIVTILNHYFSHMIEIIHDRKGIVVDFFGDAILVFFDPLDEPVQGAVHQAIQCAFQMQSRMPRINRELGEQGAPPLAMGIGIHTGSVVVGNIGSHSRAKYGVVGSAVNITSRIQARAQKGQILVSREVMGHAGEQVRVTQSFSADLKGVDAPMRLYGVEPRDTKAPPHQVFRSTC